MTLSLTLDAQPETSPYVRVHTPPPVSPFSGSSRVEDACDIELPRKYSDRPSRSTAHCMRVLFSSPLAPCASIAAILLIPSIHVRSGPRRPLSDLLDLCHSIAMSRPILVTRATARVAATCPCLPTCLHQRQPSPRRETCQQSVGTVCSSPPPRCHAALLSTFRHFHTGQSYRCIDSLAFPNRHTRLSVRLFTARHVRLFQLLWLTFYCSDATFSGAVAA